MAQIVSPLLTLRRFEALAHGVLPRPLDTAVALGTKMIGSAIGTTLDAAIIPGLIVAMAIAARVGHEAARRRHGEKSFGTSTIALARFLYLGCAALAAIMALRVVMAPTLTRLLEVLGI